jgi:hypothetical protein
MQVDRCADLFGTFQDRPEEVVVEITAAVVAVDDGTGESLSTYAELELLGGLVRPPRMAREGMTPSRYTERETGASLCPGRGTPAPDSAIVCSLLQRDQNSPVIEQGCAELSPGSAATVSSIRAPSLADSITTTPEFRISVHIGTIGAAHAEREQLARARDAQFVRSMQPRTMRRR